MLCIYTFFLHCKREFSDFTMLHSKSRLFKYNLSMPILESIFQQKSNRTVKIKQCSQIEMSKMITPAVWGKLPETMRFLVRRQMTQTWAQSLTSLQGSHQLYEIRHIYKVQCSLYLGNKTFSELCYFLERFNNTPKMNSASCAVAYLLHLIDWQWNFSIPVLFL